MDAQTTGTASTIESDNQEESFIPDESQNSSENELDLVTCLTENLNIDKCKQLVHKYYLKAIDFENKCSLLHQKLQEVKIAWDETKKSREDIVKEKEQMTVKYATCERNVITEKKAKEEAEKKCREITKENDILKHKLQTMAEEKTRITCMYDNKIYEHKTIQSENESIKNENCILQNELKLCQIALKKHVDIHKTNQQNIDNLNKKIADYAEQVEQVQRNSEETMKCFKFSEENEAFFLTKQVKELQAALILLKHGKEDKDKQLKQTESNLENLQIKNEEYVQKTNKLLQEIKELERNKVKYEKENVEYKNQVKEQLEIISKLRIQSEHLGKLEIELETNKQELNSRSNELSLLNTVNDELKNEVSSLKIKEADSLLFIQQLTEKTVNLQSEIITLKANYQQIQEENTALTMNNQNIKNEHSSLLMQFKEEKEKRLNEKTSNSEEIKVLRKTLSKQKNQIVLLQQQLRDQEGEMEIVRRKSRLLMRELKKEVFQYRNTEDIRSYTSSRTSFASTRSETRKNSCPNDHVRVIQPDCIINPQSLIERLVKLQRISARKSEKIDFLEDHVSLLLQELHKKSNLLQKYMLREESGVLTSEKVDQAKARFAKLKGIMASVYGVRVADRRLTMELCLDINKKLQAILEDALLENIILKKNIDTLGCEIDKLNARINASKL